MFEKLLRDKTRFDSVKGQLNAEDLYDLPLNSVKGASLNNVAQGIDSQLVQSERRDFVTPRTSGNSELEFKLEFVKHVIAVKSVERDKEKVAKANKALRQRILAVQADRKDEALINSSDAELEAILANLED